MRSNASSVSTCSSVARIAASEDHELMRFTHLYALNRGVLLTPFHNMMLCSPLTTSTHADRLLAALRDCLREIGSGS